MTLSDFRRITDELLSAYIDDEVTEQERALIDAAIAQDEEIAWRLNSLRQTVTLLRDLPELALPRSFTLTLDQVQLAQPNEQLASVGATERELAAPRLTRKAAPTTQADFWKQVNESWRRFWQGGNPMLRNAAAVSFALMLFLVGGGQLINRAMQPAGTLATAPMPAAAPAGGEAAPAAESVALAPSPAATEEVASLQVQDEDSANKAPVEEGAAIMQAPATESSNTESAATESTESVVVESEDTESEAAVQAGEAAVAEAAPAQDAPTEESAAAAAMAAPEQPVPEQGGEMPPLAAMPFPGGEAGRGAGGGGSDEGPGGLVPEQAYGFDADPGQPTAPSAEEAVSASVAAAPASEAPAESAADMAVTPAVDAPVPEAASAAVASDEAEDGAAALRAAPVEETLIEEPTATVQGVAEPTEQAAGEEIAEAPVEPTPEPTIEPTPEAVALVAPEGITSSEVVENVQTDDTVSVTSYGVNLPVLWVAQGTALLLTVVLASLWWRSRTPRRPRGE